MLDYTFSYADLEYFLLILVRVASFIFAAPFFSMTNTPRNVRIALSFFVAILLYPVVQGERIVYDTLTGYFVIVMKEALTGLLIGFAANLSFSVVAFAGHIADMEMGLSMATLFDPATKQNTSITGIYYNYTIMLMLIISGMHQYLLKALAETYTLIPMNGAIFRSDRLMASMLEFMANYIIIGFRICLPIFAVIRDFGKGFPTVEYVCGRYADEGACRAQYFILIYFHAALSGQLYLWADAVYGVCFCAGYDALARKQ